MRVGVVVVDGVFTSGIAALVDVLGAADGQRADVDPSIPPITMETIGPADHVTSGAGFTIPVVHRVDEIDDGRTAGFDVLVVPALGTMTGDETVAALARGDVESIGRVVRTFDRPDITFAAACTGVFSLAEAGLLDAHRATTSWWLWPTFRHRYPGVTLDVDAMVVRDARVLTAGAAFAHVDLALAIVREVSPSLAELVARLLVIDARPSQGSYVALEHLARNDELVLTFETFARDHLGEQLDVGLIAAAIGTSRRTLERRTDAVLGMSPLAVIQRLRVERATHLALTTDLSVERIAAEVGYANATSLRRLLRRLA